MCFGGEGLLGLGVCVGCFGFFFCKLALCKCVLKTTPSRPFTSLASVQLHLGFWSW